MHLIISNVLIPIEQDGMDAYLHAAAHKMKTDDGLTIVKILSKSLDLRDQQQFFYKISLVVSIDDSYPNRQNFRIYTEQIQASRKAFHQKERPLVVGRVETIRWFTMQVAAIPPLHTHPALDPVQFG